MDFPRSTMAIILYEWVKQREKYEREELNYTRDSGILAAGRQLLAEVRTADGHVDLYGDPA